MLILHLAMFVYSTAFLQYFTNKGLAARHADDAHIGAGFQFFGFIVQFGCPGYLSLEFGSPQNRRALSEPRSFWLGT